MSDQVPPAAAATATPAGVTTNTTAPGPVTIPDSKPVGGLEGNGQVAEPIVNQGTEVPASHKEPAKPVVPEAYDLKLSEGSHLKPEHVEQIATIAKSKGLTQEQAELLLMREESAVKGYHETQQSSYQKEVENWKAQSLAHPEFGGEKFAANVELARRAVMKFGGEPLAQYLDKTGTGNHPDVIKTFWLIGKAMDDGQMVSGGTAQGQVPIEDRFYKKKT